MKKTIIYATIASALVLAGCTSTEDMADNHAPNTTLTADVEQSDDATRTYLGNYDATNKSYDVLWEGNDHIGIYDEGQTKFQNFTLFKGADATRAGFSGYLSVKPATYKAFYPYSIVSSSPNAATVTLPTEQTYRNEGADHTASQHVIAQNMWPAYSESTAEPLPFKNLCGAILFKVKAADAGEGGTIISAKLTVSGTDMGLNGKFTVSNYPDPKLAAAGNNTNVSTLTVPADIVPKPTLSSLDFTSLYFVVPPQTYLSTTGTRTLELQVTVKHEDETTTTYGRLFNNNKYELTVARSKIKPIELLLYKKCGFVYDETYLFWGNDDINNDGIIDVHGTNYAFPLNTIKLAYGTVYFRLPVGMTWAGDASYEVSGNPQLIRVTGPKKLDFKVYIRPDISRGKCDVAAFYAEGVTATADADIVTELITTKASLPGDVTMPVTWNNRLSSVAKTYTGATRLLDFTGVVAPYFTVNKDEMGTGYDNASASEDWKPTVIGGGTADKSSIAVPDNNWENLEYKYLTDVLRTNEAFIYTVNGTTTQKILLQQNELAVMVGGIGFSGGKNAGVGSTGNYVSTYNTTTKVDNVSEMLGFPYGYVQSAKEPTTTTDTWDASNTGSKIWYSVDTDVASPTFGTVTVKQGGYNPYLKVINSGVTQSGDPCSFVKQPRIYTWRLMSADEMKNHVEYFHYTADRQITFLKNGITVAVWNAPYCWNWEGEKIQLVPYSAIWFAGTLPLANDETWYHMYVNNGPPYNTPRGDGDNGFGVYHEPLYPVDYSGSEFYHPYQHSRPICVRN